MMEFDWSGLLAIADEFERFLDRHPDYTSAGWTVLYVFLCFVAVLAAFFEVFLHFGPRSRTVSTILVLSALLFVFVVVLVLAGTGWAFLALLIATGVLSLAYWRVFRARRGETSS